MAELITQRIQRNAGELRLHAIAENPDELIERAEAAQLGYREFLDLLLESEVGVLEGRRYQARLKMAGLPHHKTLDEFDIAFQPDLDPKRLAELRSLRFVERVPRQENATVWRVWSWGVRGHEQGPMMRPRRPRVGGRR